MAKYILDTTLLIDHLRGRTETAELVDTLALDGHRLGVCCVSITELYSGLGQDARVAADDLTGGLGAEGAILITANARDFPMEEIELLEQT
jgi:hypothetical protein